MENSFVYGHRNITLDLKDEGETCGRIKGYRYKGLRDYLTLSDYNNLKLMTEKLRKVTLIKKTYNKSFKWRNNSWPSLRDYSQPLISTL